MKITKISPTHNIVHEKPLHVRLVLRKVGYFRYVPLINRRHEPTRRTQKSQFQAYRNAPPSAYASFHALHGSWQQPQSRDPLADWRWCGGKHDMYHQPLLSENKKYVSQRPHVILHGSRCPPHACLWRNVSQHMQPCSHFVYGGRRALRFWWCAHWHDGRAPAYRDQQQEGSRILLSFLLMMSTCPMVPDSDGVQCRRGPRLLIVDVKTRRDDIQPEYLPAEETRSI